jgi:hypothetical protein
VRGAASLLADALATARSAGAARPLIVRADSGLYIANGRRHAMDVETKSYGVIVRRSCQPSRIVEVQLAEAQGFPLTTAAAESFTPGPSSAWSS